jgi:hypothetical protein
MIIRKIIQSESDTKTHKNIMLSPISSLVLKGPQYQIIKERNQFSCVPTATHDEYYKDHVSTFRFSNSEKMYNI